MIGTFLTVAFLTLKNRITQQLRRLRQPRYLIGAIAGGIYFWFMIFRRAAGAGNGKLLILKSMSITPFIVDVASVVLLLLMILAWALPADSGGLDFSETEIAFLFPAPLRRRDILLYKILRAQPQAMFSALIMTVLGWWRNGLFVGMWAVISVLSIYFMLVSLGRARLRLMHVGFVARLFGVAAIVAGLYWLAASELRTVDFSKLNRFNDLKSPAVFNALSAPFEKPLIRAILFIPRLFASAALPSSLSTLAVSVLAVVALGVACVYIAAALNISFEEASIAISQKRATRKDRVRGQRAGSLVMFRHAPAPFRLQETGPVEVAIVWKNLIALVRNSIAWVAVFALTIAFLLGMALWSHTSSGYLGIGTGLLIMACMFPLIAPNVFANDLRLDMPRLEVLKSYPIAGDRLIASEIAAPLAVISILEMLFATTAAVLIGMSDTAKPLLHFVATPQFIVTVLLLTLPVCAVQLLIRNAVPVLFPAWAGRGKDEPRGFVMTGQRLVVLAGNLLVLAVALIPAAVVFLPSIWIAHKFFAGNPAFVAVATMPAVAVLAAEVWMGVRALGAQFETIDISNESDVSAP
ncbi:MAG TPA: putative ABC exporter domain-containing protein [Thermoanaerobaculia bacterium]|nr:putative ABC exporter domain-containing protein [Thermoanaerobaculia bacterium]